MMIVSEEWNEHATEIQAYIKTKDKLAELEHRYSDMVVAGNRMVIELAESHNGHRLPSNVVEAVTLWNTAKGEGVE